MSEVAEHLGFSLPSASRLVDGLVARGALERAVSQLDRRRVALTLSERGEADLEAARKGATASLAERLLALPPAERSMLVHGLEALGQAFNSVRQTKPDREASTDGGG